jgi:para-nitrobenzyl esterase
VFAAGEQAPVPVLIGFNAEEARSLSDLSAVRAASLADDLTKMFGALPPSLLAAYPFATDAEAQAARGGLERDLRFGWDMWAWARLQARHEPTFLYWFQHRPPFTGGVRAQWGASHFSELWYMFDQLDREPGRWTAADRRLADRMARYWLNFAHTGDPNGPGLPLWPRFAGEALCLDDPPQPCELPDLAGLKVFDATYDALRGKAFGQP